MVETQNIPELPKAPINTPAKKQEVWSTTPDSVKEAPEKTEKLWDKLKEVNQELQIKYKNYQEKKSLLDRASKEDVQAPGEKDAVDKSNAENTLKKMEDAYKKDEKIYQTITFDDTLAKKAKSTPEEQKKIEWEWLSKSVTDLHYDIEPLDDSRVQFLAKTFPEAWKNAIVDPKSVENNSELKKVREAILEKTMKNASSIVPMQWESPIAYQERLYQNFQKTTGIQITLEEFNQFTKNEYREQAGQASERANSIDYDQSGNPTWYKPGVEKGGWSGGSPNSLPPPAGWSEPSGSEIGSSSTNELLWLLGWSREAIEKNLVSISFLGRTVNLHRAMVPIIQKAEAEIKSDPEASRYVVRDLGGFDWRTKRGGSSLSNHALGIAMDINADQNMGSFWNGGRDMPDSFVNIMKKNGFIWWWNWKSPYDPMHFEYSNWSLLRSAVSGGSPIA